jgi:hypothetical protein
MSPTDSIMGEQIDVQLIDSIYALIRWQLRETLHSNA